jgi:hypothetical protein
MRTRFLTWMDGQLKMIREQAIDVCHGATGKDYPAIQIATSARTDFTKSEIIWNDILRNS